MSMIINQEYMETYVINPMAKRIADLEKKIDEILRYQKNFDSEIFCSLNRQEEKIDLLKSDIELLVNDFDKVIKNIKKVK